MFSEKRQAYFGVVAACISFSVCLAAIVTGRPTRQECEIALPGTPAPDLASADLDNQWINLAGLRGNFVLVYFAPDLTGISPATSQPSLLEPDGSPRLSTDRIASTTARENADLPRLAQLSKELRASQVTILEVPHNSDNNSMSLISLVAQSDGQTHRTTRMVLDADGDIARQFRVDRIAMQPTLFVIDRKGVIRYRGSCAEASAEKLLQEITPAVDHEAKAEDIVDDATASASTSLAISSASRPF